MHVILIIHNILFTVFSTYLILFFMNFLILLIKTIIRFIGEHLVSQIICHVRLKGKIFVSPYFVHGLINFIVIIGLVRNTSSFTSSLLRIGVSLEVIGYVNLLGKH